MRSFQFVRHCVEGLRIQNLGHEYKHFSNEKSHLVLPTEASRRSQNFGSVHNYKSVFIERPINNGYLEFVFASIKAMELHLAPKELISSVNPK